METIIKYKACDGREFNDADECKKHEEFCVEAIHIMSFLPERPGGVGFLNGGGFVQHNEKDFLEARENFNKLMIRYTEYLKAQKTINKSIPSSIAKHWSRFECSDSEFREWGQTYFSNHPNEGTQKQINRD